MPMDETLDNMSERVPSEDLDLVITAVKIQRQIGGNLSEILDRIVHTIRERIRIKGEISTMTAQGKLQGIILTLLPPGLTVGIYMMDPRIHAPAILHDDGQDDARRGDCAPDIRGDNDRRKSWISKFKDIRARRGEVLILIGIAAFIFVATLAYSLMPSKPAVDTIQERLKAMAADRQVIDLTEIELSKPFSERVLQPIIDKIGGLLKAITPNEVLATTQKKINAAGIHTQPMTVVTMQVIVAVLFPGLLAMMGVAAKSDPMKAALMLIGSSLMGYMSCRHVAWQQGESAGRTRYEGRSPTPSICSPSASKRASGSI